MTAVRQPLEQASFVDLGAGKGRVLCLAAGRPFGRVVGVELFDRLTEVARSNLGRLDPAYVRAGELACVTADAGAWPFPPGPKVVFLFNPFGPRVLERVLRRLGAERDEAGRGPALDLLYYEPVAAAVVDGCRWLERSAEASHWIAWTARAAV